ncbi:MAG: hypothetical protein ACRDRX_15520 [Pseudonocardiaceae bacterium]
MTLGLETGAADLDGDGRIAVSELYRYVYNRVRQENPDQTPTMSADGMCGQLYLARNPHAESPLPASLQQALGSPLPWERLWAIDGLKRLLADDVPGGQKRTARRELLRLRDDDTDPDVHATAGEAVHTVSPRLSTTDRRPQRTRRSRLVIGSLMLVIAVVVTLLPILEHSSTPVPRWMPVCSWP